MRLKHHLLIRPFALAATAALIATTVALAFGAGIGLAADYQDAKHNVCEGTFSLGSCVWGGPAPKVTGSDNIALGDAMMSALTSGESNVALDFGALASNTTGNYNIAIGTEALKNNTTGNYNIASGFQALRSNTEGVENTASGWQALFSNTTGKYNTASGSLSLVFNTTGDRNTASGHGALNHNTTGGRNTAIGDLALVTNSTGSENTASGFGALGNSNGSLNVALGYEAGTNLTTGSSNIDIANEGVAAEEGTTRIGTEGTQTRAFVAGVYKKPVATPACAVKVNSEGQLGCNEEGAGSTAIATFATRGTKTVASGNCLDYTDIGPAGTGACPAKTTGFSASTRLAGPTPAGGATVSNLYADSNANVTGTDTVLVAVIDNTTGATLLLCTVNSTNKNSCSNASGSGPAAAGENIEVKLTATGPSGNLKLWRVTFRF